MAKKQIITYQLEILTVKFHLTATIDDINKFIEKNIIYNRKPRFYNEGDSNTEEEE